MQDQKERVKADSQEENLSFSKRACRLLFCTHPEVGRIINFLAVGVLGFACNLIMLTALLWMGTTVEIAVAIGIATSTIVNFFFDRHLVFSYAKNGHLFWQLAGFIAVCIFGAIINYSISIALLSTLNWMVPQVAVSIGAIGAIIFNYICLRFLVFRGAT